MFSFLRGIIDLLSGRKSSVDDRIDNFDRVKVTLVNVNTKKKITFYTVPESMSDTYDASFSEKSIIGRSSPILVYSGGSSRGLSFTITMHEDILEGETDIRNWVEDIRAMSFPEYSTAGLKAPRIYCRVGSQFAFWGTLNTSVTWKGPIRNNHYIMAEIVFTFTRIAAIGNTNSLTADVPISASDIEKNGLDRSSRS